ncbi:MAG: four helix bundle protein [Candidatus Nomurabacteria bacterium]|jgi:hypothetical protein|nr:four helix bundle protein [Candidatus Nomurabacteria bacterium]
MTDLPVILRVHELYGAICIVTEKLAGVKRQTIGRRLEDAVLQLLEWLIMSKNAPKAHKAIYLIKAVATAEIIDFHLQTLLEQKLANATTVNQLLAKNHEVSRQIGGWLKSAQ